MSWAVQAVIAAIIFAAGAAGGREWQLGVQARVDQAAADVRATEAKRQIKIIDAAAVKHVKTLATLNNKLGDAREKIAALSGRECLDIVTVGLLNDIAPDPVRAPAGEPAGAPSAAALGGGLRFSTDRDAASAIAICRTRYAEVSSQLNQILDIEEGRQGLSLGK